MDQIVEIVASITKKDKETLMKNLEAENIWDSLVKLEIILAVEDELDIFFDPDEIGKINNIKDLIKVVEDKESE